MSHFARRRTDAQWYTGYLPTGNDLAFWDQNLFKSINAKDGGTWTPSASVIIGGAGVVVGGPWSLRSANAQATGDITFGKGTADDCFKFDSGHPECSIVVPQPFTSVYSDLPEQCRLEVGSPLGPTIFNARTINAIVSLKVGARFMTPIRVRNGGRFVDVIFTTQVNEDHLPTIQPRYRVIAVAADGTVLPLRSQNTTTDADGFVQQASADHVAYYNGGVRYDALTYSCTQNRIVDVAKYSYFAEIIDESGTSTWATTGTWFVGARSSFDQITLLDGRG